jgi:hypothetical protein
MTCECVRNHVPDYAVLVITHVQTQRGRGEFPSVLYKDPPDRPRFPDSHDLFSGVRRLDVIRKKFVHSGLILTIALVICCST